MFPNDVFYRQLGVNEFIKLQNKNLRKKNNFSFARTPTKRISHKNKPKKNNDILRNNLAKSFIIKKKLRITRKPTLKLDYNPIQT